MAFVPIIAAAVAPMFASIGATGVAGSLAAVGASAAGTSALATGLTIGSAALGATSAIVGGIAAKNAGNYQAQIAKNNATIAQQNADAARIAGQAQESAIRRKVGVLMGEQLAAQGASGVDVGVGSPLAVRGSTAMEGDMDALTVRYNAMKSSYGYGVEAQSQLAQSAMYKSAAKGAMVKGVLGAGASIIGGASSLTNSKLLQSAAGIGKTSGPIFPSYSMDVSGWDAP